MMLKTDDFIADVVNPAPNPNPDPNPSNAGPEQIRKSGGGEPTIRDIGATNDQIGLTQDDIQKHRDRLFFLRFWQPISNRTSDFLLKRQRQEPVATVSLSRTISIMDDQKWHRIIPVGYPSNNPSNNYKKLGGSWCSSISGVSQGFHMCVCGSYTSNWGTATRILVINQWGG